MKNLKNCQSRSGLVLSLVVIVSSASALSIGEDASYVLSLEDNLFPEPDIGSPIGPTSTTETETPSNPDIHYMHIYSNIRYRYSTTLVTCSAENHFHYASKEIPFQIVLPNSAYISKFVMNIDGESYEAYVKEKEEARNIYNQARTTHGRTSGIVEVSARDSNIFNLNINLKPLSNITFQLTYEEFLVRKLRRYEQIIHVSPERISKIPNFKVTVNIMESQNISYLRIPKPDKIPDMQTMFHEDHQGNNNSVSSLDASDTRHISISRPKQNMATIEWEPTSVEMNSLAVDGSTTTKFVVQYDVARTNAGGEILLMNGYFVHFFAPHDMYPQRKHIIFVLDVSGSMSGRKIVQLKNSMKYILDDLKPDDYFNIITFSSGVKGWDPSSTTLPSNSNTWSYARSNSYYRTPILATEINLRKGHNFIDSLVALGETNINSALLEALKLASVVKPNATSSSTEMLPSNVESVILFLTDGEPTTGITSTSLIFGNVRAANVVSNISVPIYSLAFGADADFNFVKKLALQNYGFGRKIYEAADADLQLKGFYKEISSPMLSNAKFRYTTNSSSSDKVALLTQSKFKKVFDGSEVVVAGRITRVGTGDTSSVRPIIVDIDGNGRNGLVSFGVNDVAEYDLDKFKYSWSGGDDDQEIESNQLPTPHQTNTTINGTDAEDEFLERFWAYLTIKQLIEKDLQGDCCDDENEDVDLVESDENLAFLNSWFPNSTTKVPVQETPKQRALKLSLKYGFVTPLTSLVVVQPNNTESRNVLTEAPAPIQAESPTHYQSNSNWLQQHQSVRRVADAQPGPWYRTKPMSDPISTQSNRMYGGHTFSSSAAGLPTSVYSSEEISPLFNIRMSATFKDRSSPSGAFGYARHWLPIMTTSLTSPTTTSTTPRTTTSSSSSGISTTKMTSRPTRRLTLDDISWLPNAMNNYNPLRINGTTYHVASYVGRIKVANVGCNVHRPTNGSSSSSSIDMGFGKTSQGICKHLKDCVLPEFINNVQLYYNAYFCPLLRSTHSPYPSYYAGVCC